MTWNKKLVLVGTLEPARREELARTFPGLRIVDCSQVRDRVAAEIEDAELVFGRVKPEEFERARRLEFIQIETAGVEHMMYPALQQSNVVLANAGDTFSPAMAEHVLALVLAFYRRLPDYVRWQDRAQWNPEPLEFLLLRGKTVGFLGTGTIARHTVPLCRAFGCAVIGWNRRGENSDGLFDRVVAGDGLSEVLRESDVVVNTLPITPRTERLVDRTCFAQMKDTAFFVNVGRGRTVDEAALVEALETGVIAGAGLDVFEEEPLPPDSPLWRTKNAILTGHRSGLGGEWAEAVFRILMENLRRRRDGEPLLNEVDKEHGY